MMVFCYYVQNSTSPIFTTNTAVWNNELVKIITEQHIIKKYRRTGGKSPLILNLALVRNERRTSSG
jgi:hypothetical protein